MHQLSDEKLRGLIIEKTGQSDDSSVVSMTLASIKAIKKFADWSHGNKHHQEQHQELAPSALATPHANSLPPPQGNESVGLNLSYTINLNLPATSDIAVFNAIFKSLKENLLRGSNEQG